MAKLPICFSLMKEPNSASDGEEHSSFALVNISEIIEELDSVDFLVRWTGMSPFSRHLKCSTKKDKG